MRAIAIDDEPMALEVVRLHAAKVPYLELVACFTDAFKALEFLQNESVDLLFLDIKMPDISGLEFVTSLQKKPMVIFTTAYTEHAVTSFELDAIDYLLKPFSLPRFIKACNKAHELLQLRGTTTPVKDYIFLKTGYEQVKVFYEEILYMEAAGNYVTFVLQDKKLLSRMTINELSEQLPTDKFIRVHRSYIVAKDRIDKIERHQVTIKGNEVPVGASYMPQLQLV
ncbi:response regulator transcription factor [Pontibacter sp. BT310]|uniref:LytTR family DNA-binding domain-containing protein n=1 Tax=Pontibacter populi TaxID=890055 RepID=A0ABS6XDR1_9BACT|nr:MULTISPECIES: LytTR family DNA-binding domain-containing protein [Pontibacter]MBJ6119273.1 response regulator transcription factor [Pontibacter sp. BT310]MBR0571701.1 response regulator transcription factor [Microvirga sp. STS03]MBW3366127.1 LytTR family DNA-binding domain-containing protein [Pontibacter populi]